MYISNKNRIITIHWYYTDKRMFIYIEKEIRIDQRCDSKLLKRVYIQLMCALPRRSLIHHQKHFISINLMIVERETTTKKRLMISIDDTDVTLNVNSSWSCDEKKIENFFVILLLSYCCVRQSRIKDRAVRIK